MGLSKNIAYRLRTLREASGLSQVQVAEKADLSLSLVTKMEQGRKADPRASTLLALAAALGVRAGQLIEDLTPPPEGMFPAKKKGKKKSKKLAALLTTGTATNGHSDTAPQPPTEGEGPPPFAVVPNLLGTGSDEKKSKKKKRAKK